MEQFEAHLSRAALAPATVTNYLADLRAFFRWSEIARGADCSPLGCDAQDIRSYSVYLQQARSHAAATVNRRLQALRKFYHFALAEGWVAANPADDVRLLPDANPRRPAVDVDRVLAAMQNCGRDWPPRDRAIIQAMLGAGLKLGEVIQLRVADVHLGGPSPCLAIATGQNGQSGGRLVPLDGRVCEALRAYAPTRRAAPGVERFFVTEEGRPLSTRSVQRLLHECARAAGLETLTAQDLRYVYARTIYAVSGDVKEVGRLLGHRHLATTIRYLRPDSQDVQ